MNNKLHMVVYAFIITIAQTFCLDAESFVFKDRKDWQVACKKLPMNIDVHARNKFQSAMEQHPDIRQDRSKAFDEWQRALMSVISLYRQQLQQSNDWTDKQKPVEKGFARDKFVPYAEKLSLDAGKKIVFHGDFHGDIHSFIAELQQLEEKKILKPGSFELLDKNVHLAFLGDYVDRGNYGVEVLYTLFRLKLANPDNIMIIRGNHEDANIHNYYGFGDELQAKFPDHENKDTLIEQFYNSLPVVGYVGHDNNYLQCCHGGLEYGYRPQKLLNSTAKFDLIGELKKQPFKKYVDQHDHHYQACCKKTGSHDHQEWYNHPEAFNDYTLTSPTDRRGSCGFMWHDFLKHGDSYIDNGRGLAANQDLTKAVLDYQNEGSDVKVKGIFRAHQHSGAKLPDDANNLMYELIESNGIYSLWQPIQTDQERSLDKGLVWTFNVAPDGPGNKNLRYGFDAYGILTLAKEYKDWKLTVHNPMIIDRPNFKKPV